ncbi:hypothetical protein ARALYDRAFT_891800 [Arabidopsis lyrata subsp. lyrata]|uniref:SCP domain-containing protein n=1 Tax=Arabidopsis lyrata subsp. lyrata TaxID=81972 RepID=D7KE42_ARALL|nr:hypothetical protein ARALYDRAFT_891800 [Arabidopsis lyrata subsp. lyrata]
MNTLKTSSLLIVVISFLVIATNAQQDYVTAHNTPPYNYANSRKADCNLTHSTGSPYGENLAKGSSSTFTGVSAVNLWVAEKKYYNYTSNSCIGIPYTYTNSIEDISGYRI